jgi:signal transduction histidine kinase/DNA-binding response OmpR family regulator
MPLTDAMAFWNTPQWSWTLTAPLVFTLLMGGAAYWVGRRNRKALEHHLEETMAEHGSELAQVNTQLLVAMEQAQQAARAKSAFLASMSHELRTPLNAILLYSELLQEDGAVQSSPTAMEDVGRVRTAGRQLLQLIDEVLDISRLEAGRITIHPESVDLHLFLPELASEHRALAAQHHNRLEMEMDPLVGSLWVDRVRLRQVLTHLLTNALKFTQYGVITLAAEIRDGDVRFSVRDTGPGMTPEALNHALEAFTQVDERPSRKHGGAGLGLALCKGLIELMGGRLEAESALGKGSRFSFQLPITEIQPSERRKRQPLPQLPRKAKALVVDDDPLMRDALTRALTKEGFWVGTAADGREGLELSRSLRPDLITLDLRMEGMDGYQVLQTLKSDPELKDIPVILISMLDERSKGFALGATEVMQKPVSPDVLAQVLDRFRQGIPPFQVLVVEDDAPTREALVRAITQAGWLAVPAPDGESALAHLALQPPQLLLLDLMLPGMDGFALVERMQQKPEWKDIPVIVLTGKDTTPEEQARLAQPNVHKVLRKGGQGRRELVDLVLQLAQKEMQG